MTEIFNTKAMKERRQILRRNMTETERILWSKLRRKQIDALRFRRQYSVDTFVLDFYCPEIRLDVEVDGESHDRPAAREYDQDREEQLKSLGIAVLRFTNEEVKSKLDQVVQRIKETAASLKTAREKMQPPVVPLCKGDVLKGPGRKCKQQKKLPPYQGGNTKGVERAKQKLNEWSCINPLLSPFARGTNGAEKTFPLTKGETQRGSKKRKEENECCYINPLWSHSRSKASGIFDF